MRRKVNGIGICLTIICKLILSPLWVVNALVVVDCNAIQACYRLKHSHEEKCAYATNANQGFAKCRSRVMSNIKKVICERAVALFAYLAFLIQ